METQLEQEFNTTIIQGRRRRRHRPMSSAVPFLALVLVVVLLLAVDMDVVAADQIIYPPLHNNEAVIMEPVLINEPYGVVPDRPYVTNVVYDIPHHHQHHDDAYDGIVYEPVHKGDLPPNRHRRPVSTRVDEYGRPIPPPASPSEDTHGPTTHHERHLPPERTERDVVEHSHAEKVPEPPVYNDEPFLHQALDTSQASTDVTKALDHDLGELNVREEGDDLTVHVGKNKVKTETVATITATITATDEHEDSYINIHRNAHEASAGHEHDHLDGKAVHLDGARHEALDQEGGHEILPDGPMETPAPDLSFLQDVEVLKVLFPWLEQHSGGAGGQEPEPPSATSLDQVMPP